MSRFPINSTKNRVDAWVTSDSYETALIELSEEARNVEILKCEVEKTCGFFFSKEIAESHYWSIHRDQINPNMDQIRQLNENTTMKATSDTNHVKRTEKERSNIKTISLLKIQRSAKLI